MMLKHILDFEECKFLYPFQSHFQSCSLIGSVSGDDQEAVVDSGGVRGVQMHPPLAASNLFLRT